MTDGTVPRLKPAERPWLSSALASSLYSLLIIAALSAFMSCGGASSATSARSRCFCVTAPGNLIFCTFIPICDIF